LDDLILRALQGDVSHDEAMILAAWRAESTTNERRFQNLARLSGVLEQFRASESPDRPSARELIAIHARRYPAPAIRRVPAWAKATALAAVLILAVGIGLFPRDRSNPEPALPAEITTGDGETTTARLPDGSVVRLAERSRLVLTGGATKREVWLQGTGYFAIAKRPGSTFTVNSASGSATVLGTRFEMRTTDERLRVVVVEGKVAVSRGHNRIEVSAGEITTLDKDAPASLVKVDQPRRLVGWMGRSMLFQDSPLGSVMGEIEEQFNVRVVLTDSALSSELVSASFTDQPLEQILSVVCQVVDAKCSNRNGVITVTPKQQ